MRKQAGFSLLEALIGMVLMAVIGLGLGFAQSRALYNQRYLNTQNLAVSQMRESLINGGQPLSAACASGTGPTINVAGVSQALSVTCSSAAVSVSLGGGSSGTSTDDHEDSNKQTGTGASTTSGNGTTTPVSATLPANAVVTSMQLKAPASDNSKQLLGADGAIEISL